MTKKFYLILKNYEEKYIYYLKYYFREFNCIIFNFDYIKKYITDTTYNLIIFNKNYFPFKNFKNNIDKLTNNFSFLNEMKDIIYISSSNYSLDLITNELNITQENNTNIIFDDTTNYNILDHEEYKTIDMNYNSIYTLYYMNSNTSGFYNKTIPIKSINNFITVEQLDNFYNIIIFLNNNNFNLLFELEKINYKNARITIFSQKLSIDNEYIVKAFLFKNKKKNINLLYSFNFIKMFKNILLSFENLIFINNKQYDCLDIDFKYINNVLKHYKIVLNTNYYCIPSNIFVEIPLFELPNKLNWQLKDFKKNTQDNEYHTLDYNHVIYNYIFTHYMKDIYIPYHLKSIKTLAKTFSSKLILPNNYKIIENNLLIIKDYNKILQLINNMIEENTKIELLGTHIIKKITIAILTDKESILNDEILSIINNIDNKNSMIDIELLIRNTKFDNIKKDILVKLLNFVEDDCKLYNYYLRNALFLTQTSDNIKTLLKSINKNINHITINSQQVINNYIIMILKQILPFHEDNEIIIELNNIIMKLYDFNDITNFDSLLKLNENENINSNNKLIIINFLMIMATHFNPYYKNYDEFISSRENIKNNLIYLKNKINVNIDLEQISFFNVGNFFLSYQGIPSVDIFKLKSEINRNMCSELNYIIPVENKCTHNMKIKVLFHAEQLSRVHSVYKDRHQVIKMLANDDRFDIYFSTFDKLHNTVKYTFGNAKHILLPKNLLEIKNILIKHRFDIIIYCEIGMFPLSYYMAHLRLAPKQCNIWGHSDTSGISTIDYFFSSKLYELEYSEASTHYSEKLILQNSLCTCYVNPVSRYNISTFKNRYHYGFTDENIILFCAQSLFKLNPIFDDYIYKILTNIPNSVLILSDNNNKYKVVERFNNMNIMNRIYFFPGMIHYQYMNLMNISDIFLDVYPFGGCNSSFEAFSLNIPIVTQPSQMINGRFTTGFYKKMGLDCMICNTKEEYIEMAIKLGCDVNYRKEVRDMISAKKDCLFMDMETIEEWKSDLIKIYNNII